MLDYPEPPVLVDDLLIAGTLAGLISKPGLGKSFAALDLALSVASGWATVFGLPLRLQGPAVYIVGEGAGRFRRRLKAWKQHHGVDRPLPFFWVNGPVNLLDGTAVEQLARTLGELRPSLLVVDTLSRCLVGADENSQQVMTQAVAALDQLRTSSDDLGLLILHHTNAAGSRERGSTVLNGALDTQLLLREPTTKSSEADSEGGRDGTNRAGHVLLTVTKQKDLDQISTPIVLRKHEVALTGEWDPGGQPATSLVLTRPDQSLSLNQRIIAEISAAPGLTKKELAKRVTGRTSDVLAAVHHLAQEGTIRVDPNGREHRLYAALTQ